MSQPKKPGARGMVKRLIEAAGAGRLDEVRQLLASGADVNARSGLNSALTIATALDQVEVVRELLAAGADPNVTTKEGLATLSLAQIPEVARLLIEAGAEVNRRSHWGQTALFLNAHAGVEVLDLFLAHGADVEIADDDGETPLMWAVRWKRPDVARRLLQAGADPNRSCRKGETALHRTIHPEIVRMLIEAGADVNARDRAGETVLRRYAWKLSPDLLSEFLDHGADPNIADSKDRMTPLMEAARLGNPEVVRILVERGADLTLRDRVGRTALDWAGSRYDQEVRSRVEGYLGGGSSRDQLSQSECQESSS